MDAVVSDFDGVLTDNFVYVLEGGLEAVRCSRSDGLAFDALDKLRVPVRIISTERNPIVKARGDKLGVPVLHGVGSKSEEIRRLARAEGWDLQKVVYVGNDVNDLLAMRECGHRACPADAHPEIVELSTVHLMASGGYGVIRELVENAFGIDIADVLESERVA